MYYELSFKENIAYYIVSSISLFIIGYLFYHMIIVLIAFTFISIPLKKYVQKIKNHFVYMKILREFKDVLMGFSLEFDSNGNIISAIRGAMVFLENNYFNKSILLLEFKKILLKLEHNNFNDVSLFIDLGAKLKVKDISDFFMIYSICKETGADIGYAIRKGSEIISNKVKLDKEVRDMVFQRKLEGYIIFSIPIIVLTFLNIFAFEYISVIYSSLAGNLIMTLSLILIVVSMFMIIKITDIRV